MSGETGLVEESDSEAHTLGGSAATGAEHFGGWSKLIVEVGEVETIVMGDATVDPLADGTDKVYVVVVEVGGGVGSEIVVQSVE